MDPVHDQREGSRTESSDTVHSHGSISSHAVNQRLEVEAFEYEEPLLPVTKRDINVSLKAWWIEISAMLISITCLAFLICMPGLIRDEPRGDWPFRYQPNSVVSLLITVCRSALSLCTASCLSQLAWLHFQQRPGRLVELQEWDEASRGPWGAIRMICHPRRYGLLTILGSFITIATLFMDTITQQVLSFPISYDPSPGWNASFPVTQFYGPQPNASAASVLTPHVNTSLQAAVIDSVYGRVSAQPYYCPTALCEWPTYGSLGVCSSCTEVTTTVQRICYNEINTNGQSNICNYTTPSGLVVMGSLLDEQNSPEATYPLINATYVGPNRMYAVQTSLLLRFAIATFQSINGTYQRTILDDPTITECSLQWCAIAYELGLSMNSTLIYRPIRDFPLHHIGNYVVDDTSEGRVLSVFNASDDYPEDLNHTFTLDSNGAYSLTDFLSSFISYSSETITTSRYGTLTKSAGFSIGDAILSNPSIEYMADTLALGMTNAIRNMSGNEQALGTIYTSVTHIKIQWLWLIYALAIILLGIILVVATIIDSHHAEAVLWKTFPLAFLFHPLEGRNLVDTKTTGRDEMEKIAKSMSGQLMPGSDGVLKLLRS